MKVIIKFSPEIFIKSRSVRIFFITILIKNIRIILKKFNVLDIVVIRHWDYFEIYNSNNEYSKILKILENIPGIHHFLLVQDNIILSLEDIYHHIFLSEYCKKLIGKTFCVRVKRYGNHIYNSKEIESYLGEKICSNLNDTQVNLTNPEEIIRIEIKNDRLFIVLKRYDGLGGLPIGTQHESISLISGGFDSAVSSYMLIRRGCKVHYCFFNLGGIDHAIDIYKIVYHLWTKFSSSHTIKLISIDFLGVINEIRSKIKNNLSEIILKRMMMRVAISLATFWKIKVLITGEVLGQVSSQTLDNLVLINDIIPSNYIVLRPLISYDKETIIELARKIGTEELSRKVVEYCGISQKKSVTKAEKKYIEQEEKYFDYSILNKTISNAYIINVCDIPGYIKGQYFNVETTTQLNATDIILDIRSEKEQENNPLKISCNMEIQKIPFYKLVDQFPKLNQNKMYLLYCSHGLMSRLQAMYLYQKGFRNIKIYHLTN